MIEGMDDWLGLADLLTHILQVYKGLGRPSDILQSRLTGFQEDIRIRIRNYIWM